MAKEPKPLRKGTFSVQFTAEPTNDSGIRAVYRHDWKKTTGYYDPKQSWTKPRCDDGSQWYVEEIEYLDGRGLWRKVMLRVMEEDRRAAASREAQKIEVKRQEPVRTTAAALPWLTQTLQARTQPAVPARTPAETRPQPVAPPEPFQPVWTTLQGVFRNLVPGHGLDSRIVEAVYTLHNGRSPVVFSERTILRAKRWLGLVPPAEKPRPVVPLRDEHRPGSWERSTVTPRRGAMYGF